MQKKFTTYLLVLIIFFSLTYLGTLGIASDKKSLDDMGAAEIILKTHTAIKPARFPHKKHQNTFECGKCHHSRSDDGKILSYAKGMKIKKCVSCHNKNDMSNVRMNTFKLIAHSLCKECHRKYKDSAPTRCSGCHIK